MALRRLAPRLCSHRRFMVTPAQVDSLLSRCGLRDFARARAFSFDSSTCHLFAPLFTPHFTTEHHRLTTLGDTLIDAYLSRAILHYAVHAGLVLTVNATRQLTAALHNHFALRLFARELRLDEFAFPLSVDAAAPAAALDFLAASGGSGSGPRAADIAGTAFAMTPLRAGQSPLGAAFSHLVGALHAALGPAAAEAALAHAYDGIGGSNDANANVNVNVPGAAVNVLRRTLGEFPAGNVAEALLAAQGLPARFVAKTRMLPEDHAEGKERKERDGEREREREGEKRDSRVEEDAVVCSGFGVRDAARDAATIDSLSTNARAFASLAAGPGGMNAIATWQRRDAAQKRNKSASGNRADGEHNADDGWIEPSRGGPAFAHAINFSSAVNCFADAYGTPQPINGQRIARHKFRHPPRDPLFYDRRSDMRDGVPIDTDGETTTQHVDRFLRPHKRLFEVSLVVGSGDGRTVGRAVSQRYTMAREAACRAFVAAVLHDLQNMRDRVVEGTGRAKGEEEEEEGRK